MSDQDLVEVFEGFDMTDIIQARLALETANIPFVVEGERTGATEWATSAQPTVFRVAANRAEDAREAIEDFLEPEESTDADE